MKLNGILSAKSKRTTWERNQAYRVPKLEPLPTHPENIHKPQPGPDGTLWCCAIKMTPAAHVLHVKGERLPTVCGGVSVAGSGDPWLAEQDARIKAQAIGPTRDDEAERRAEQVDAYYDQRRKPVPYKAAGTSESITD